MTALAVDERSIAAGLGSYGKVTIVEVDMLSLIVVLVSEHNATMDDVKKNLNSFILFR